MKAFRLILSIVLLCVAGALPATAAGGGDRPIGQLADGTYYIRDEVDFCLKEGVARTLSPTGPQRRVVDTTPLVRWHADIGAVVGGHLTAARWLNGEELPARIQHSLPEVPVIARSLKAMLRSGADAAVVVEALRQNTNVEWASLNVLHRMVEVPNDPDWNLQWGPHRIRADEAWDVGQASTAVRVAIIDTGVDLTQPDLASRIVYNRGFGGNASGDCQRDARGGGSIDHGTHVAGIATAIRDNSIGIAGVATAGIMAMGCATWNASASQYGICCVPDAINDAVANGADAINCSFANPSPLDSGTSSALDNAQNHGVVVVCAAGNDATNIVYSGSAGWAQHAWPLMVSSTDPDDSLSGFSNYGSAVALAAPGNGIYSTFTTNYTTYSPSGEYGYMSGTSMASPHVAGSVAVVRGMNPSLISGSGTKDLLYRMAQDLGPPGKDDSYGYGMVQLVPSFLRVLKNSIGIAGYNPFGSTINLGTYELPYSSIPIAAANLGNGGTLILNGGLGGFNISYPPQPITKPMTLTAFPDRPVTLGR